MTSYIKNPKTLRKSNKANVKFTLWTKGEMSRLQLAKELGLTTPSITQLINELEQNNEVSEGKSIVRGAGRPEVLIKLNLEKDVAIGLNIETDYTHLSVCGLDGLHEEKIYKTQELIPNKNLDKLISVLKDVISKQNNLVGIGIGIVGIVKEGVSVNSFGILEMNTPLEQILETNLDVSVSVINNIQAQARALLTSSEDNYMLIKHSPGIGCAIVADGKVVNGENNNAGEIGHTIVEKNGIECRCGKKGCLEAYVAEWHIEDLYYTETGDKLSILQIYDKYENDKTATKILDKCIDYLALSILNISMFTDPKRILLTGGIFAQAKLYKKIVDKIYSLGFNNDCSIESIGEDKQLKALSGAKHILLKKIFEV